VKQTSPVTAILFLGLATAVGAAAWLLSGSKPDDAGAAPIERSTAQRSVGFQAVSPKDLRKQKNLEAAKRKFKRIEEVGEEVSPGLYMLRDSSGMPTYYSTELIEGRGRNGEPLYMSVEFAQLHTAPLRDGLGENGIKRSRLNPKAPRGSLSFGKPKGGGGAATSGAGGSSGGSQGGDGGGDGGSTSSGGPGGGDRSPPPGDKDG
jgi:hypothetical protein